MKGRQQGSNLYSNDLRYNSGFSGFLLGSHLGYPRYLLPWLMQTHGHGLR